MKQPKTPTKRPHLNDIRATNRARILELLLQHGAASRKDLSLRLELTNATISRITKELIDDGVCYEGESYRSENQLGRHQTDIFINPEGGFVIAICISAFSQIVRIADLSGKTRYQTEIPVKDVESPEAAVKFISSYIDKTVSDNALNREKILGAVLAIAGSTNVKTGYLNQSPLLKWSNFPIGEKLCEHLSCPIRVENIADTLCFNYMEENKLKDSSSLNIFLIHIAIGMGASLAIEGRIVRRRGNEGLIGKIPASSSQDHSKNFKRLDQVSSGLAILQRLESPDYGKKDTFSTITKDFQAAVKSSNIKSGLEERVFLEAGQTLGESLMALTVAYAPDIIVLEGPVVDSGSFCEGAINSYKKITKGTDIENTEFLINKTSYIEATQNLALREYLCKAIMG
ncbi:ROK family transcriptional regulator [Cocleimonas flava]|uniref:Putative NBD/HSP70 family sugar kinase n=1 Tax=Cocleimonas flava TaxID=634765 RepID=A0A4R1F4W5_9GAMM|nr:ROK family transcriptional regulator [Cocleimonas flava]TCJ89356.1 putative NBD/HSP70 family sugar kinase [Cocleimonas flava]